MDKDAVIRKIKRLSALVASDNPHEAEAAARQMAAMMEQYRIEEGDLHAAEVEECSAKSGSQKTPVRWECQLAFTVAQFYGTELLFSPGFFASAGNWKFIGVAPAGQLGAYAFAQLFTKARIARRLYMAEKLKRTKRQRNKTAKADVFAEGWVREVRRRLPPTTRTERQQAAIDAYMQREYPITVTFRGRKIALSNGVTTGGKPKLIGGPA